MDYKKAIQEIKLRRKNDLLTNEQQIISALRQNGELRKLDIEIRFLQQQIRTDGSADDTKTNCGVGGKTDGTAQKLLVLKQKRSKMLSDLGIDENVPYRCDKCSDTGMLNAKPCPCVISMTAAAEAPLHSFEDSDLSIFKPADRERAEKTYRIMLAFCQKFPNTNSKNIILFGKTGTGKTFLASCVAENLQERGFSTLFISAFDFVNRMLKYHTAPVDEKLEHLLPLIDCDLLIIDDLGTESMLKNVTVEYLYNILNERMRQGKHFMITTNLDQEGLAERYGERIFSRLSDKRLSAWIVLAENDLRRS